jgi:hypothetical protein
LMFMAIGLGWFVVAAVYLVAHALWRAYQFLNAPAHMHMMRQPTRPAPQWLVRQRWLYTAALQRFWLDPLANWLLVNPTHNLACDLRQFDGKIVERMVGSSIVPGSTGLFLKKGGRSDLLSIGVAPGLLGTPVTLIAQAMEWFEEHLILKGGGEGLLKAIQLLGGYLSRIDLLLSQPRYLLLMIMATLVVIL